MTFVTIYFSVSKSDLNAPEKYLNNFLPAAKMVKMWCKGRVHLELFETSGPKTSTEGEDKRVKGKGNGGEESPAGLRGLSDTL